MLKQQIFLSLFAIWSLLPELIWAQYPGIVNSQPVNSKLSLEQMLIGLRSSPPHTASEFLASIVSHYGVPIFRQLTPSGPDSIDSYQPPSPILDAQDTHLSSAEQPSLVFRQYDQQQVDNNRRIAVWIPGNPASSLQTTSKLPHSRSRVQFSMQDIAESANCEPEIQTVKLEHLVRLSLENVSQSTHAHNELVTLKGPSSSSSSSVSDLYFPHCIRLPKCGGCCPSERLKCTPIDTQKQIISIMHVRYSAHDRRFQFCGLRRLTVERHTKCACQCRQKLEDCLPSQRYLPDECRCVCRPFGHALADCQAKQFRAGVLRPFINWNSVRCRCECRPPGGVWRCSSGHRFNYATCRCEIEPRAKRIRQLELHRPVSTSPASSVSSSTTRWPTSSVPTN